MLKDEDISESKKIMELLNNNGADINATDNFGHTALDLTTDDDKKFLLKKIKGIKDVQ